MIQAVKSETGCFPEIQACKSGKHAVSGRYKLVSQGSRLFPGDTSKLKVRETGCFLEIQEVRETRCFPEIQVFSQGSRLFSEISLCQGSRRSVSWRYKLVSQGSRHVPQIAAHKSRKKKVYCRVMGLRGRIGPAEPSIGFRSFYGPGTLSKTYRIRTLYE